MMRTIGSILAHITRAEHNGEKPTQILPASPEKLKQMPMNREEYRAWIRALPRHLRIEHFGAWRRYRGNREF